MVSGFSRSKIEWLSCSVWAISGFGQNERDPVKKRHVQEREMRQTAHFACILDLVVRLLYVHDITFGPLDLDIKCEGSRSKGKMHLKERWGRGLYGGCRLNTWFKIFIKWMQVKGFIYVF